jgi:3-deoxy-8-phosphooctulonate synthase
MRIIAGPCQHESYEHSLKIATECKRVCDKYDIDYYFKASYDKANRTSINGKRGVGLKQTMDDFYLIKDKLKVKTLTDVHDVSQINLIKHHFNDQVDVLQIPAFLCRQTDLIEAACATDKIVNIKKGQFLAPWDVQGILSKCTNAKEVWKGELALDTILWSLTSLVWTTFLITSTLIWFSTLPTQYKSQAVTEGLAAAIAITFLAWLVLPVLWVLLISS